MIFYFCPGTLVRFFSTSKINLAFRNTLSPIRNSSRLGKWIYFRNCPDTLATARTFVAHAWTQKYDALQAPPRSSPKVTNSNSSCAVCTVELAARFWIIMFEIDELIFPCYKESIKICEICIVKNSRLFIIKVFIIRINMQQLL